MFAPPISISELALNLTFSSLVSSMMSRSSAGGSRWGWVLNKFATNAKFSFSWPFLTSYKVRLVSLSEVHFELLFTLGVTNCLQPILSAWSSITPALSTKSDFCIAVLFTPASYNPS